MKDIKIWFLLIFIFFFQYLLSDLLTIRYYRPDFIVIYILYKQKTKEVLEIWTLFWFLLWGFSWILYRSIS